jgi:hypothetical protein
MESLGKTTVNQERLLIVCTTYVFRDMHGTVAIERQGNTDITTEVATQSISETRNII